MTLLLADIKKDQLADQKVIVKLLLTHSISVDKKIGYFLYSISHGVRKLIMAGSITFFPGETIKSISLAGELIDEFPGLPSLELISISKSLIVFNPSDIR